MENGRAKVIALAGQKGGIGKTTVSILLACELYARGREVAILDADPQGSSLGFAQAAAEKNLAHPDVYPMATHTLHLPDNKDMQRARRSHDILIIDCPPKHDSVQVSALMACDLALFPCGPSTPDIWGMSHSAGLLRRCRKLRPEMDAAVVLTRLPQHTVIARQAKMVFTTFEIPALQANLSRLVSYEEFMDTGQSIAVYAPESAAAREVVALTDEVLKRLEALP